MPSALLRWWYAGRTRRALTFALCLGFSVGGPGTAQAQDRPTPGASSVLQYVELVPTASGPAAPGVGGVARVPLTPRAREALDKAGPGASGLVKVSSSTAYGAPPTVRPMGSDAEVTRPPRTQPSLDRMLKAFATAAADVGDARRAGLVAFLVVFAVGGATLALIRRMDR